MPIVTASVLADMASSTSSAGAMMERIGGGAQGQMSQDWAVENLFGATKMSGSEVSNRRTRR